MAEVQTQTSETEPGEILTSTSEPESPVGQDTTAEGGTPPDALESRLKRLEANIKGTHKELEKERARASQLEEEKRRLEMQNWQMQSMWQQQQQAAPAVAKTEYSDEELAQQEYQAIIDGNPGKLAEVRRKQREAAVTAADQRWQGNFQQMAAEAQRAEALKRIMSRVGITDPTSQAYIKTQLKMRELSMDPDYATVTRNDPALLATLASEQVKAELAAGTKNAKEQARDESVEGAYTEGSRGSAPGKGVAPRAKMSFTEAEMKLIRYDVRRGMKEEDAKKRYWNNLPADERDRRIGKK